MLIARRALLGAAAALLARPAGAQVPAFQELTIDSGRGRLRFAVELVATPEARARGLMFRERLAPLTGMLFDFVEEQHVAFWMRNTLIPLDMVFIGADGVVRRIHERAVPHDETAIPSGVPIRAVLEIAGGEAARLGIRPGDRVHHPIFGD